MNVEWICRKKEQLLTIIFLTASAVSSSDVSDVISMYTIIALPNNMTKNPRTNKRRLLACVGHRLQIVLPPLRL